MSVASATSISVDETSEALKFVTMTNAAGDTAKIYTFGACITSYIKDGKDSLMVRPDAKMDGSKPISGGVPFCFPQFGPGAMQQHGFARNLEWAVAETTEGDAPSVVLKLVDSEYTRAMWDCRTPSHGRGTAPCRPRSCRARAGTRGVHMSRARS